MRVVIVGRPNVGKSTLFNRLSKTRKALVHDEPGVTRDRIEKETVWWVKGKPSDITLIDTGGLGGDRFHDQIEAQVGYAVKNADVVLIVFDGQEGFTAQDQEVMDTLRKMNGSPGVPVLGVVNKIDADKHEELLHDFYSSGLEELLTLSAEHNLGIDELMEKVVSLKRGSEESDALSTSAAKANEEIPKIAIVGQPNVGKSTLLNALAGEDRMITSPVPGTTVDAVDTRIELNGKPYLIVDTAGIRRKSKTEQGIEVLSVVLARKALERSDVALLVIDGVAGVTEQDQKIAHLIEETGSAAVIAVNKWDQQRGKDGIDMEEAANFIRSQMHHLNYAPILFISAIQKRGLHLLSELIEKSLEQRKIRISTHDVTDAIRREAEVHNPLNAKFFFCHQIGTAPATFLCHVNDPKRVEVSLRRHLAKTIRERWGFFGNPIRLKFTSRKRATT